MRFKEEFKLILDSSFLGAVKRVIAGQINVEDWRKLLLRGL